MTRLILGLRKDLLLWVAIFNSYLELFIFYN